MRRRSGLMACAEREASKWCNAERSGARSAMAADETSTVERTRVGIGRRTGPVAPGGNEGAMGLSLVVMANSR